MKKRTEITEEHLQLALALFNQQTQTSLPADLKLLYSKYNEAEEKFFQFKRQSPDQADQLTPLRSEESEGRVSGSKAWRQARGEIDVNDEKNGMEDEVCMAILSSLRFDHLVFEFPEFHTSGRTLVCNGDSKIVRNYLQLTNSQNDQRGL
jgi:hypothetical protein